MRFLVDECTGPVVATWLREQGHAERLLDQFIVVTENNVRFAKQ